MEEEKNSNIQKKVLKINLKLFIIIAVVVAIVAVTIVGLVIKNKRIEETRKIEELEAERKRVAEIVENSSNKTEKENNKKENTIYYNDGDKYTTGNFQYLMNGYIKDIDDETRVFSLENPKISFEYPNSWAVSSYIEEENWEITIESPQAGVDMRILSYKRKSENADVFVMLDSGSTVTQEGKIKVSNYDGYYKKYVFADARL